MGIKSIFLNNAFYFADKSHPVLNREIPLCKDEDRNFLGCRLFLDLLDQIKAEHVREGEIKQNNRRPQGARKFYPSFGSCSSVDEKSMGFKYFLEIIGHLVFRLDDQDRDREYLFPFRNGYFFEFGKKGFFIKWFQQIIDCAECKSKLLIINNRVDDDRYL